MDGKKIPVYAQGQNIRDWIYVEDHCKGILAIFYGGKVGEKYNIGGECEVKNIDLVRTIIKLMGASEDLIEFVEDRPGHDLRYSISNAKINERLKYALNHTNLIMFNDTQFVNRKEEVITGTNALSISGGMNSQWSVDLNKLKKLNDRFEKVSEQIDNLELLKTDLDYKLSNDIIRINDPIKWKQYDNQFDKTDRQIAKLEDKQFDIQCKIEEIEKEGK